MCFHFITFLSLYTFATSHILEISLHKFKAIHSQSQSDRNTTRSRENSKEMKYKLKKMKRNNNQIILNKPLQFELKLFLISFESLKMMRRCCCCCRRGCWR